MYRWSAADDQRRNVSVSAHQAAPAPTPSARWRRVMWPRWLWQTTHTNTSSSNSKCAVTSRCTTSFGVTSRQMTSRDSDDAGRRRTSTEPPPAAAACAPWRHAAWRRTAWRHTAWRHRPWRHAADVQQGRERDWESTAAKCYGCRRWQRSAWWCWWKYGAATLRSDRSVGQRPGPWRRGRKFALRLVQIDVTKLNWHGSVFDELASERARRAYWSLVDALHLNIPVKTTITSSVVAGVLNFGLSVNWQLRIFFLSENVRSKMQTMELKTSIWGKSMGDIERLGRE